MWQRIKDILKDLKSYVGLVVGLFGVLNNYLHLFMPLLPRCDCAPMSSSC